LHRDVEPGGRAMQAEAEVGAADHPRIVFRLEPSRAQLNPPRRQPRKPPFELGAPRTVTRNEDDEVRKSAAGSSSLPIADAVFEIRQRADDEIEVFVLGPAR